MSIDFAQAAYERAAADLERALVMEELRQTSGLTYARVGPDVDGPYLVAYDGELRGEAHTDSPGPLGNWWATETDRPRDERGPYPTLRSAAASLIPRRCA